MRSTRRRASADAACTINVVVGAISYLPCPDSPVVPKYLSSPPLSTCPAMGKRIYEVGARYGGYYVRAGVYSAGAEIPASMFAEMSVTTTTTP